MTDNQFSGIGPFRDVCGLMGCTMKSIYCSILVISKKCSLMVKQINIF